MSLLLAGGTLYLALILTMFLLQDRLLYLPENASMAQTEAAAHRLGLRLWAEKGEYRGLAGMAPEMDRGTVLLWHGNAGTAADRSLYVAPLRRLGYQVVLLEYPGYGPRPGQPNEQALVTDAVRAAEAAMAEFPGPFYAWGESLGAGVAAGAASVLGDRLAGVVLLTPWDTLPALAQHLYWYLPVKWLIRDRYDLGAYLHDFSGPVAVLLAGQDEIIPNRHTRRLYQRLPGRKRLWQWETAGHNSWPHTTGADWWEEVMTFMAAGTPAP